MVLVWCLLSFLSWCCCYLLPIIRSNGSMVVLFFYSTAPPVSVALFASFIFVSLFLSSSHSICLTRVWTLGSLCIQTKGATWKKRTDCLSEWLLLFLLCALEHKARRVPGNSTDKPIECLPGYGFAWERKESKQKPICTSLLGFLCVSFLQKSRAFVSIVEEGVRKGRRGKDVEWA